MSADEDFAVSGMANRFDVAFNFISIVLCLRIFQSLVSFVKLTWLGA